MAEYPKLHDILSKAVVQACEESSMLLGQELHGESDDCLNTNKITYFGDTDDAMMVAAVDSRDDYPGRFFMIFTLRDAILLSSLMLGIPPARVNEKRRLAILESDDIDAFGEIMNQIIGSFNTIFKPNFTNKSHLKLVNHKKFVPGIDEASDTEPIPAAEYFLCRYRLLIPGHEMDRLDLFVPHELAALFDPPPEPQAVPAEMSHEETASVETAQTAPGSAGEAPSIIVMEDDASALNSLKELLSSTGLKIIASPLASDVRGLFSQGDIRLVMIGVQDADDHVLSLCIKLTSMQQEGKPFPLIMCSSQWTRSSVLKALKYGASDILMKPYASEEVLKKVNKHLAPR